jgi:hypothetical protein
VSFKIRLAAAAPEGYELVDARDEERENMLWRR